MCDLRGCRVTWQRNPGPRPPENGILWSRVVRGDGRPRHDRWRGTAQRRALSALAHQHRLGRPACRFSRTIVVRRDAAGYGPLRRYASEASKLVGVWVNVITDDAPAAGAATEAL